MNMQLIASTGMAQRQSLPLDAKIQMSKQRIKQWYEHHDGDVYVAFSGGVDSTVLADLVWSLYPEVPWVFSNTGLEYPEIVRFVKERQADGYPVQIIKPKKTFRQVVLDDGFPLVSKKVAEMIERFYNPKPSNAATRHLYLTGYRKDGVYSKNSKIPEKWKPLIDAPFRVTASCCDSLKKEPFRRYKKETGRMPINGMMSDEGGRRGALTQCNVFDGRDPQSRPILFWTKQDIWEYIKLNDLPYSEIYDDRVVDGVRVDGEDRTGCMFCAFGAHLEKGENRFQRMARTHPKQWNYCIKKLGMNKALDFIGVPYEPLRREEQIDLFSDAADQ